MTKKWADLSLTELADILQNAKQHPELLQPIINGMRAEEKSAKKAQPPKTGKKKK
jgi:hypothetical protein